MGRGISVVLDGYQWPTRAAAEKHFKAILHDPRYRLNDPITDPEHDAQLRALVEIHPEADVKIGVGIDYFFIGLTSEGDRFNVRPDATGIWIRRVNGSKADWSYLTAIREHGAKQSVKDAMRLALEDRRMKYRERRFADGTATSDLSGTPFTSRDQAAVIYIDPTWEQLSFRFAESEGGWDAIEVHSGRGAVRVGAEFADPHVEDRWLDFHAQHARLALATRSELARRARTDETAWTP
ncbi:DUF3223 domain-containing protein [Rathayibacter tritici]|uniref:DUF3223 domain-containing protein n=1 Tax=Rathayibacter tritici TaxID=33888 RepID=A0A160KPY8_9MICO|nr:hypothetical protein A6122_0088 [Rathayibacter tritici]PPI40987.1 DUF3223 domain-containing protein [Rathayibacter tritici]